MVVAGDSGERRTDRIQPGSSLDVGISDRVDRGGEADLR
jgi:hypothetical protein